MTKTEYQAKEDKIIVEMAICRESIKDLSIPSKANIAAQRLVYLSKELYAMHDNYEFLVTE